MVRGLAGSDGRILIDQGKGKGVASIPVRQVQRVESLLEFWAQVVVVGEKAQKEVQTRCRRPPDWGQALVKERLVVGLVGEMGCVDVPAIWD